MPPRDRAVCVVLGEDDTVLVVRRFSDGRRYCVLPGGGVEDDERPDAAALRELLEETGLVGSIARGLGTHQHAGRRSHYFLVRVTPSRVTLRELATHSPEQGRQSDTNRYSPTWIPVADRSSENLQPVDARELVSRTSEGRS